MKIVTWNVNSVRARLERVLAFLEKSKPDVACLQETKVCDADFPAAAFRDRGWHVEFHGQKTYNGVAILARTPLTGIERGFCDGDDDTESRLISAKVDGVRVMCLYVPNGQAVGSPKYAFKLRWLHRLRLFLDRRHRADEPLIACGDWNIAPEDRDVWDPELWRGRVLFSEEEKAALRDVCGFGLSDALRLKNQEGGVFTWWDYRMGAFRRNLGLRIDHVLLSPALASNCSSFQIDTAPRRLERPSDHAPVVVNLNA
jgi:exodeoxyribonuclease-3